MSRFALMAARFLLSAWVGAAALFVVNSVREVTSPDFDSAIRDRLALLRFPPYYVAGFALVGLATLCVLIVCLGRTSPRRAARLALGLLVVALSLVLFDYFYVYRPLARMIDPPGGPRPAEFQRLHARSEMINTIQVGCCGVAALTLCWPRGMRNVG